MASHTSDPARPEADDQSFNAQIAAINGHRIAWLIPIFVLVHLAHIAIFWPYTPGAVGARALWRNGVISVHAGLLAFAVTIYLLKALLGQKRAFRKALSVMPELLVLVYLFGGAALAIVDQRVTTNINALLVVTIGASFVIVIRPIVALFSYAFVLIFFLIGVTWTQTSVDLLMTIRVNSISAAGLGFGLALLQWRNQMLSLRQQRRIDEQQRELEAKNRELTWLATRDTLTGLLNRGQFLIDGNREVMRLQGTGSTACLIMVDVDHFKVINDTYGHPGGDSILREIAGVLTEMLGSIGLLSRFGGEEFAILLPGASVEEGLQVAEQLRVAIAEQAFAANGKVVRVTASFGVAEVRPESTDALDGCYRAADLALYQAKNDGRNCVRCVEWRGESHGFASDAG